MSIDGDIVNPQEYLNFTDIKFKLREVWENGEGLLSFSEAINAEFLRDNFEKMFEVYRQNSTYVVHNLNSTLESFEIVGWSTDQKVVKFRFTVDDPQLVGMLIQRKDMLYIRMKEWLLDPNGQIPDEHAYYRGLISNYANASLVRFFHRECLEDAEYDKTAEGGAPYYAARMNIFSYAQMPQ